MLKSRIKNDQKWHLLLDKLQKLTGKRPDLNAVLFLIGVQELGRGSQGFTKEEKQDLMHLGTCRLLAPLGYFEKTGVDSQGWPVWEKRDTPPQMTLDEQEYLIQTQAIEYFEDESIFDLNS